MLTVRSRKRVVTVLLPDEWDADVAVASLPTLEVTGPAWRCHLRTRDALSEEGYRYRSGRFHRGIPEFGEDHAWPALYLSSAPHVCLGEYLRHIRHLEDLRDPRLSQLEVNLGVVLDCRDVDALGITREALLEDIDYTLGQRLAAAAIRRGCEGLVVPSATHFKEPNLVVFPRSMRSTSNVVLTGDEDPQLYIEQAAS
jgi:RES domain